MYRFSSLSWDNLKGVDPRLVAVASRALAYSPVDFMVTEGLRSKKRQRQLVASGASQTMNSKHLVGKAIDVAAFVNGHIRWDWPLYPQIAKAFKRAARELEVPLSWGGDWSSFRDGPHFQLDT